MTEKHSWKLSSPEEFNPTRDVSVQLTPRRRRIRRSFWLGTPRTSSRLGDQSETRSSGALRRTWSSLAGVNGNSRPCNVVRVSRTSVGFSAVKRRI